MIPVLVSKHVGNVKRKVFSLKNNNLCGRHGYVFNTKIWNNFFFRWRKFIVIIMFSLIDTPIFIPNSKILIRCYIRHITSCVAIYIGSNYTWASSLCFCIGYQNIEHQSETLYAIRNSGTIFTGCLRKSESEWK